MYKRLLLDSLDTTASWTDSEQIIKSYGGFEWVGFLRYYLNVFCGFISLHNL